MVSRNLHITRTLVFAALVIVGTTTAIGQVDPASSVVDPEAHGLPAGISGFIEL
jgi:hypothetical protein